MCSSPNWTKKKMNLKELDKWDSRRSVLLVISNNNLNNVKKPKSLKQSKKPVLMPIS